MTTLKFPADFVWGVAASAYQIEGAWNQDGRGESIWDRYAHSPHHILTGENADIALDHYHRMPEDVALMKQLRLSVALAPFNGLFGSRPELVQAGSPLTLLLPLILFVAAQRFFVQGIVITGVEK